MLPIVLFLFRSAIFNSAILVLRVWQSLAVINSTNLLKFRLFYFVATFPHFSYFHTNFLTYTFSFKILRKFGSFLIPQTCLNSSYIFFSRIEVKRIFSFNFFSVFPHFCQFSTEINSDFEWANSRCCIQFCILFFTF